MPAALLPPFLWLAALSTLAAGLGALLPRSLLAKLLPLEESSPAFWLFFRHWGVLVVVCGTLLVWAAGVPAVRPLVLPIVAVEKFSFAFLVFNQRQTSIGRALRGGAVADFLVAAVMSIAWLG